MSIHVAHFILYWKPWRGASGELSAVHPGVQWDENFPKASTDRAHVLYTICMEPVPSSPSSSVATARTFLFVPGDRPERFDKAIASGADVVVLDLEDAVAPEHKDAARTHVTAWRPGTPAVVAVRVNAIDTSWHEADLDALTGGGPVLVMLAKAQDPTAVAGVVNALPSGSSVIALIETALGVLRAADIAQVSGVHRLALGTFDLAAELGVDPDHRPAMAEARSRLVLASAAARLAGPVDGVTGDVRNHDQLVADVEASAAIGFAGKLCIHPGQVAPAAAALAPSPEDVGWAARVLAAANSSDHGVVVVDGRMVDAPVISRAQRITATAS
jgi:citrate lyase subunit beta/citryl-CoA lyase